MRLPWPHSDLPSPRRPDALSSPENGTGLSDVCTPALGRYGILRADAPGSTAKACSGTGAASQCDLLFITPRKSEALFSPSTRYRDLALGPSLFHWESQSTTTAASATGQRTIHHEARGSRVLLYRYAEAFGYVREQRRQGTVTEPFACLEFATYEGHEGERPMAIGLRLDREIPAMWMPVMALAV